MVTANGVYNTASAAHSRDCLRQITGMFKSAEYPPCSVYSNAESRNAQHMLYLF
jgi:hypothetical protein